MATRAGHDAPGASATQSNALNGIPALTPEELAEFIDSPEPINAPVETTDLDE